MANSILLRKINQLEKSVKQNIDYLDIDYRGVYTNEVTDTEVTDIVLRKGQPLINAYKIWLMSKSNDFIRKPGYAGFLQETIHTYPFSSSSEEQIEQDLKNKSMELFPNLSLLKLEVKCMAPEPTWQINIIVKDNTTNLVGISDDKFNPGSSISFKVENQTSDYV